MAINEQLTNRVRQAFAETPGVEEKKMFSGIAFMVNKKLCVSVGNNRIMCRIDPDLQDDLIRKPGCATVIMKGRDYKGYIWVNESVLTSKKQIDYWVKLALDFNPQAKATAKKKAANKRSNKLQ
jgi:TfoX/Sxy family transcriptional regulator of competence genes